MDQKEPGKVERKKFPRIYVSKGCVHRWADSGEIRVRGDGEQTRSFLYIDDCIEDSTRRLMESDYREVINIGSEEMVTINELIALARGGIRRYRSNTSMDHSAFAGRNS